MNAPDLKMTELLDIYPGGTLILDETLTIVYVTPKFNELFPADNLIGLNLEDLFSPRDRKGTLAFHNKLSRYEKGFLDVVITLEMQQEYLVRLRMTRQQALWVAIFENILAEDDDLFRVFHIGRERWTSIVRNSSEGIAMLDAGGRLVEFNSRFLEMLKFRSAHGILLNEDAVRHKCLFDLMQHPATPALRAAFEKAKTEKTFKHVTEIWSGAACYTLELTPVYLPVQGFTGCSFVIKDISSQKELEQLIAELDAYAHTVAHDLKNPLGVITGYVHLIETQFHDLPAELKRRLDMIASTSRKMNEIISALLLLGSVRNQQVELTTLRMDYIVQGALARLASVIETSGAQINVPEEWLPARGYAPWVEEIWANYLSNAIKYGGKPPVVTLRAEKRDQMIYYWVEDNGAGISETERASLFSEFTRLEKHADTEGHGLGLSIVQRIATRLQGEVGVESTPGKGSAFYFALPAVR